MARSLMLPEPGSRFFDADNTPHVLSTLVASGGEGTVWQMSSHIGEVAKIYKRARADEDLGKLRALLKWRSETVEEVAAWPRRLLHDAEERPVGFVMRHVSGAKPIGTLINPAVRLKNWPDASFAFLTRTAINLCILVELVHSTGAIIGDLNDQNVLIDRAACATLLDVDSIQIRDGETFFPCPVGMALFTAPELFGQELRDQERSVHHDSYALGVLLFQLLMTGRYPFAGVSRNQLDITPQEAAKRGFYAYSRSSITGELIPPPGAPPVGMLPDSLCALFERAFTLGTVRPGIAEWRIALEELEGRLTQCYHVPLHQYRIDLTACPWCELSSKVGLVLFDDPELKPESPSAVPAGWSENTNSGLKWTDASRMPETEAEWQRLAPTEVLRLLKQMRTDWESSEPDETLPAPILAPSVPSANLALIRLVAIFGLPYLVELYLRLPLNNASDNLWVPWLGEGTSLLVIVFWMQIEQSVKLQKRNAQERWEDWCQRWRATNPLPIVNQAYNSAVDSAQQLAQLSISLDLWERQEYERRMIASRERQLSRALKSWPVDVVSVPGLTEPQVAFLHSYDIKHAADITPAALQKLPEVTDELQVLLLDWVQQQSAGFTAQPDPRIRMAVAQERRERAYREGESLREAISHNGIIFATQWEAHAAARRSLEKTRVPVLQSLHQSRAALSPWDALMGSFSK